MSELVIVGGVGGTHVGTSLERAARATGHSVVLADTGEASAAPPLLARLSWCFDHRPARLGAFSRRVERLCERERPQWLLATGLAPLDARALDRIGRLGAKRLIFLTDDPWNRSHGSARFRAALRLYDAVFTPRRSNLEELRALCPAPVQYLRFAVDPALFSPLPGAAPTGDVFFAGVADAGRAELVASLAAAGLSVRLFGSYWERFPATRGLTRGQADPSTLRREIAGAKLCLLLVQHRNRDGHSMRTFEVPAVGGCALVEDTAEHREIFGEDGEAVAYFRDGRELVARALRLAVDEPERARLAAAAHARIEAGGHTYADRLRAMLAGEGDR